jgi:hypothetical protein
LFEFYTEYGRHYFAKITGGSIMRFLPAFLVIAAFGTAFPGVYEIDSFQVRGSGTNQSPYLDPLPGTAGLAVETGASIVPGQVLLRRKTEDKGYLLLKGKLSENGQSELVPGSLGDARVSIDTLIRLRFFEFRKADDIGELREVVFTSSTRQLFLPKGLESAFFFYRGQWHEIRGDVQQSIARAAEIADTKTRLKVAGWTCIIGGGLITALGAIPLFVGLSTGEEGVAPIGLGICACGGVMVGCGIAINRKAGKYEYSLYPGVRYLSIASLDNARYDH